MLRFLDIKCIDWRMLLIRKFDSTARHTQLQITYAGNVTVWPISVPILQKFEKNCVKIESTAALSSPFPQPIIASSDGYIIVKRRRK